MRSKIIPIFVNSAGTLLLALASILLMSNWANATLVSPKDPIFLIPMRDMFWILGGMALAVAVICLLRKPGATQIILILWFSVDLIAYRFCLPGVHVTSGFKGFFSNVDDAFQIPVNLANVFLYAVIIYLLSGSILSLMAMKTDRVAVGPAGHGGKKLLKMPCFFCQEEITFAPHALGEKIPCPHCKMDLTLKEQA